MNINFAMWRKASWELIKMDDKKEWDALDVVSQWLIATRFGAPILGRTGGTAGVDDAFAPQH